MTGTQTRGATREIADHLLSSGRPQEAVGLYHHLIDRDDADPEVVDRYVISARSADQSPVDGLLDILRRRPDARTIRDALIRLQDRDGMFAEVLDLVLTAPEDGSGPEWLVLAANAAMKLSDEETAQELYQAALDADPGHSAASAGLARIGARRRDYEAVLDLLDGNEAGVMSESLNHIGLRVAAHRRLGRTGDAARAASEGLDRLLAGDQLHDAARLLDRLGFSGAGGHLRDRIRCIEGQPGRTARNRLATHLLVDGRPSEALTEYRTIGGRNWQKRISGRNRERLLKVWQGLGGHRGHPDWSELERMRVRLPDDAFARMLQRGRLQTANAWDVRRVLLVTGTLGSGGAERQVVLTARGLQNAGTARGWPQLATLQDMKAEGNAHLLPDLRDAGVTVHDLAGGAEPWRRGMPAGLAHADDLAGLLHENQAMQVRALCHLITQTQPGVVHGWQDASGAMAALAALLCGVPCVVIGTRSVAPDRKEGRNRPWLNDLMRGLLADPRVRLVNNSRSGARDYERWLALRPGEVSLIPNGFDLPMTGDAPDSTLRSDRVRIGGVMRLTEEKRPDLWLDVIVELLRRGLPVEGLLVGDGPMMARISGRVAESPYRDRITLAGRQEDMVSQYAGMDLLLLTSRTEGLPNVLVEAQALGVPVVSTDAGGTSETFLDGRSGLLCRSGAADELADALERLIGDSAMRGDFAAAGIEHARTEFSLARMIERTARLYGWQEIRND